MRSLYEHLIEMQKMNNIILSLAEKSNISHILNKISNDKINKLLKGGELVNKRELHNCQDNIEQFILKNNEYNVCVRKIKDIDDIYYIVNFYSSGTNCVLLQMDIKNKKCHLTELLKQQGCIMKKKEEKYNDNIKDIWEILIEIVIKICNKFKIDVLYLTDNSYILCKNNPNSRINLIYSKMILDGDTWYGKFGFEPIDEFDKKTYKENQVNYKKNILTKYINKEKIISEILNKEKKINHIQKISEKYDEMVNEKLSIFMKWISENYCEIYSEIYEYIYRKAGYKKYTTLEFELKFNTNLLNFVNMIKSGKL
jgi:hypothetical protein